MAVGRVGLGSGERATLDLYGNGFLQVAVPTGSETEGALVNAGGRISASGGRVELKAATVREAIRDAVNVSGVVAARSVSGRDGAIVLGGGDGGNVKVTGKLSTSGQQKGGRIEVSGRNVTLDSGAAVKAKAKDGSGGWVTVTAAETVTVANATVEATSATATGGIIDLTGTIVSTTGVISAAGADGGRIGINADVVLAGGTMDVSGTIGSGGVYQVQAINYVEFDSAVTTVAGRQRGGVIVVTADTIFSSGTQDASSSAGRGGNITLDGLTINLVDAALDASGSLGGGTILIGGDYRGGGSMRHANTVFASATTTIAADAVSHGDGGQVVLWSDHETAFYGHISARGGALSGNGGLIETSVTDAGQLIVGGLLDAGAANGRAGQALLDPKNIIIDDTLGIYPQYQLIDPLASPGNWFGDHVVPLSTGNVAVTAYGTTVGSASNAGAVHLYNGETGALISSLVGSSSYDYVGGGGITAL